MEYLIVLTVIVLSVLIGLLITDKQMKDNKGSGLDTNVSKPPEITNASKQCPRCKREIAADVLRCGHCGTFVDFLKNKT